MARTPRNQNSKSPATTNVGEMFVAIASHEIKATTQEIGFAELYQQKLAEAKNKETRDNRRNSERRYQGGSVIVQYSYDGTPQNIFCGSGKILPNTMEMIFNPCLTLRKIPFFLYNVSGFDLVKCYFNRETMQIQKVKQTTFQIG